MLLALFALVLLFVVAVAIVSVQERIEHRRHYTRLGGVKRWYG